MLQLDVSHIYSYILSNQVAISTPMKTSNTDIYIYLWNIFRPPAKELLPLNQGIFASNDYEKKIGNCNGYQLMIQVQDSNCNQ